MNTFVRSLFPVIALFGIAPLSPAHAEETGARSRLIPTNVRPEARVTEPQLADLLPRLAKELKSDNDTSIHVTKPTATVTRIRALLATVKVAVSPEEIDSFREEMPEEMPADTPQVPLWGRPYLAAAVVRGWWKADTAFFPEVACELEVRGRAGDGDVPPFEPT